MVIDPRSPSPPELPRLVIAAPGSGHGKTTVATGLMAALRADGPEGRRLQGRPGLHRPRLPRPGHRPARAATSIPHLCGEDRSSPLLLHGARRREPADIAVIEGVMGLFDGQIGGDGFASTAHVASLIQAPVILVLDISQASRTAAAIVHGLNTFDPHVRLSGVILNKAGSVRHAARSSTSIEATGLQVLGVLPRDAGIEVPSRHLGLVPAAERAGGRRGGRAAGHAGSAITSSLGSIIAVAQSAPPLEADALVTRRPVYGRRPTRGPWWRSRLAGPSPSATPRPTSCYAPPAASRWSSTRCRRALPAGTAGLYLGGGFPEVHAAELAANDALRSDIRAAIDGGHADGRRVRRAALPVPHRRRAAHGRRDRGRRDDDRAADPALPHRGRRP